MWVRQILMSKVELDLYLRSSMSAHEQYQSIVERLKGLVEKGVIAGFDTYDWADEIMVRANESRHERCNFAIDKFREFEDWAERTGMDIRPCFDIREYESSFTNETRKVVVLPVMCVAAYLEDELEAVYPCFDGDEYCTVRDYLDALEVGAEDDVKKHKARTHG